jgi:hypothetical protein
MKHLQPRRLGLARRIFQGLIVDCETSAAPLCGRRPTAIFIAGSWRTASLGVSGRQRGAPDLPPEPGVHATVAREFEYKRQGLEAWNCAVLRGYAGMAAMSKADWPADGLTLGWARQRLIDPPLLARYERAESLARERAWGAEMIRDLELRQVNAEFFERLERAQYRIDGCRGADAERANVPASELRRWKIDWHQNTATDAAGTLWRDLRVWRTAASASEPAPDQAATGGEDTQTGDGPGRPAVVDAYIRPEAERLINSGEVKPTKGGLASFSRRLEDWWGGKRETLNPPQPAVIAESIANALRDFWNSRIK